MTTSGAERRSLELKGVALLLVLAFLVWLAIASYNKTFVDSVDITVRTARAGLQLSENGDVRMRGALIGRIASIDQRGDVVELTLALDPDEADRVPKDARARILPTTLFGQKYVELVAPAGSSGGEHIEAGDVIGEDRSAATVELTRVLDRLEPVLTAVQPQDLSMTLQAIADGLEGRGEQIGRTVVRAEDYLEALNTRLPQLTRDLALLADVSNVYADAAPSFLRLLEDFAATGLTLVENRDALARVYEDVRVLSETSQAFLDRNGDGVIETNRLSRPILALLARYSPELPCVFRGLVTGEAGAGGAFYDGAFHANIVIGNQFPGYTASDRPEFGDRGRGPTCAGLPNPPTPYPAPYLNDGADYPTGAPFVLAGD